MRVNILRRRDGPRELSGPEEESFNAAVQQIWWDFTSGQIRTDERITRLKALRETTFGVEDDRMKEILFSNVPRTMSAPPELAPN